LQLTTSICSVLLFCLVGTISVSAKTRKSSTGGKAVASTSKKSVTSKGKTSRHGGRVARRSAPRQSQPTVERYTQIQQALADKGYYTGTVTGVWGEDSVAALKKFQQDLNLAVDGKLGALSLIALGLGPKREPISQFAGKPESSQ
jgi:peptidoglycan hydrolase-like protein with peptidoglycan-binding domain